jgi:hypothetical protein
MLLPHTSPDNNPPLTPPHRRTRTHTHTLDKPSPNHLSSLLSVFGARKSSTSVSKMSRSSARGRSLRGAAAVSYAESPQANSPRSDFSFEDGRVDEEVSEDELNSDTITIGMFTYTFTTTPATHQFNSITRAAP